MARTHNPILTEWQRQVTPRRKCVKKSRTGERERTENGREGSISDEVNSTDVSTLVRTDKIPLKA